MSWLSKVTDLAGKAETLLNQLDQNTAVALSKTTDPSSQRPYAHAAPARTKRPSLDELSSGIQPTFEQPSTGFSAAPREYAASDYGGTAARQKYTVLFAMRFMSRRSRRSANDPYGFVAFRARR